MKELLKNIPLAIRIGILIYLTVIITVCGYLAAEELRYAIPLLATGLVGAFFAIYRQGKLAVVPALFGLILNLVLLFAMAAEDIFVAIQQGDIPNLHYGLPLVAGLFGYLLGQVHHFFVEEQDKQPESLPANVVMMRSNMVTEKDLQQLEKQIANTVSQAVARGISEGLRTGLQQALHPVPSIHERRSA